MPPDDPLTVRVTEVEAEVTTTVCEDAVPLMSKDTLLVPAVTLEKIALPAVVARDTPSKVIMPSTGRLVASRSNTVNVTPPAELDPPPPPPPQPFSRNNEGNSISRPHRTHLVAARRPGLSRQKRPKKS